MDSRVPLLIALALFCGCSTYKEIPRAELVADASLGKVRVATIDGFEYRFAKAEVYPDTLVGFYEVTEERTGSGGEVWFEDVLRRQEIPLPRVARVELVNKDPVRTALYGATIAAAGYFLVTLVDENRAKGGSVPGGGKGGIVNP